MSQQALARAKDLLIGRRRLQELHGAQWVAPPSDVPTLSLAFSADRCPELGALTPSSSSAANNHEVSAADLSAAWKKRYVGVRASDCPHVPPAAARDLSTPCWKSGVCRCKGSGRWLNHLFTMFRDYVRGLCASAAFKEELMQGWVVMLWSGHAVASDDAVVGQSASSSEMPPPTSRRIWTHVALQYLQPWRPTFVEMQMAGGAREASGRDMSDLGVGPLKLSVQTTATGEPRMWSVWQLLETLSQDLRWEVEAWHLSARLCPSILDGSVVVFRVQEPARVIWIGPEQRNRAAPSIAVHEVWSEDPAEIAKEERRRRRRRRRSSS